MHTVDEPLDDGPRQQLEVADARADLRVNEPGARDYVLLQVSLG